MTDVLRWPLRILAYAAFMGAIGYLSIFPRYAYSPPDMAEIKVSLSHAADRVEPCRRLTPEQVAALAPNMRRSEQCERERLPLTIELDLDGQAMLQIEAPPSGVWSDGPASIYERFQVKPGPHRLTARLRDTGRSDGWDYTHTEDVILRPGRYFTVTFKAATGGFVFR